MYSNRAAALTKLLACSQKIWAFPFWGDPIMRIIVYWGLYIVVPLFWETTICREVGPALLLRRFNFDVVSPPARRYPDALRDLDECLKLDWR